MWHTDRLWGTSGTQVSLIDSHVCYAAQYIHSCSYTVCTQHPTSWHTHSMSGLTHPTSVQTLVYPQRKVPFLLFHMWAWVADNIHDFRLGWRSDVAYWQIMGHKWYTGIPLTEHTRLSLGQSCMLYCTVHSQLFIHWLYTTLNIWVHTLNVWTYPSNVCANSCIPTKESSIFTFPHVSMSGWQHPWL